MSTNNAVRIGQYVRRLRLGKGLTQEKLAKDLGLSRSSVANLEAGVRPAASVRLGTLASLSAGLGVDLAELVCAVTGSSIRDSGWELPVPVGGIGERLIQVRAARGMTAIGVSRKAGVHQNVYLTLESRQATDISVGTLVALAVAFRVSPGRLAQHLAS